MTWAGLKSHSIQSVLPCADEKAEGEGSLNVPAALEIRQAPLLELPKGQPVVIT